MDIKEYIFSINKKYKDDYIKYIKKEKDFIINEISDLILINFNNDLYNKFCLFSKDLNIFITESIPRTFYKNNISKSDLDIIKTNWKKINIYENMGNMIYLINYDDIIYIIYKYDKYYKIYELNNNTYIYDLYQKANIQIEKNDFKKLSLIHNKYNKILYFKNNINYEEMIDYKLNKIYFSCLDELIFDLEKISLENEKKKKISINGYILELNNEEYIINTNIYQKIYDMMPYYSNINKCYIELYKNDNLCFIINYMSQYTSESINRINNSIRTLSKEILNIYHFTRNKQNSELYNILSNNYKTILYDIHKIFIYFRKNEIKENKEDKEDIDLNLSNINVDIIYKYLKKINTDLLINIYIDRTELIKNIKNIEINYNKFYSTPNQFKIIFNECSYTRTLSILLNIT
jgi:hypothetical protein